MQFHRKEHAADAKIRATLGFLWKTFEAIFTSLHNLP
jgi:hypothetical protein